jgi:lipoprotein NlpI
MCLHGASAIAADPKSKELVSQGNAAFRKRDLPGAISSFTHAIAADPSNPIAYYNRGRVHDYEGRFEPALADYNEVLKLQPEYSGALQLRGALHLRLGHFEDALADFNRYLKLSPKNEPHHWQRGIAFYYLGRYEEGRRQFEQCHRINTNDIEHTLWHFACVARLEGLDKARGSLLPAGKDPRPRFERIHSFYAGKSKREEVLEKMEPGKADNKETNAGMARARFYLGLFYEATGNETLARQQMLEAAEQSPRSELILDIARVHAQRLRKSAGQKTNPEPVAVPHQ